MDLKLLDKKSLTIITSVQLYVWSFAWYISECFWVQLTNEAFGNEPRIISTYQGKGVDAFSIRFISIGSFLMKTPRFIAFPKPFIHRYVLKWELEIFYRGQISKATKLKRTWFSVVQTTRRCKSFSQKQLGGEFWACYVITHKVYCREVDWKW